MRFAIDILRRLAFSTLIYGIVGGLWFAAAARAERDQLTRIADEYAQPMSDPAAEVRQSFYLVFEDPAPDVAESM